MRLVRLATAPLLAAALGCATAAAASVPPPPPPLPDSVPKEIGGYSTHRMLSVYQHWLRREVVDATEAAFVRTAPKRLAQSKGDAQFLFIQGPTITASSLNGVADFWQFDFVCPRPSLSRQDEPEAFWEAIKQTRRLCAWQARNANGKLGRLTESDRWPDFQILAKILAESGVENDRMWDAPRSLLSRLGDSVPALMDRAVEVRVLNERQCPAVRNVLETFESLDVKIDLDEVGSGQSWKLPPPHQPSLFRAKFPISSSKQGEGSIEFRDLGSGLASDSWRKVDESLRQCSEA